MTDNKNVKVNVSGIVPALSGTDEKNGNWFLIDKSGEFSLDRSVTATIWLVGGGCDGEKGYWNDDSGRQYTADRSQGAVLEDDDPNKGVKLAGGKSGKGGDGGYVIVMNNIKIPAKTSLPTVIAERNDQTGTSLSINGITYKCNQNGSFCKKGGSGGWVPSLAEAEENGWEKFADGREDVINKNLVVREKGGENGVATPCTVTETIHGNDVSTCYVGSSGSGGAACNGGTDAEPSGAAGEGAGSGESHRSPGTDAIGYGCGGGGGATCGNYQAQTGRYGGYGKKGCIIVQYVVEQPTLVVQKHYKKVCNTHKTCNTDYYSNNSHKTCCGNTGCGCKSVNGNYEYTDTIHIGSKSGK